MRWGPGATEAVLEWDRLASRKSAGIMRISGVHPRPRTPAIVVGGVQPEHVTRHRLPR